MVASWRFPGGDAKRLEKRKKGSMALEIAHSTLVEHPFLFWVFPLPLRHSGRFFFNATRWRSASGTPVPAAIACAAWQVNAVSLEEREVL